MAAPPPGAARNANLDAAHGGSKCSLAKLRERLRAAHVDVDALWARVTELVLRTLLAVHDAIPHQPNAFELFGFDVLIDAQLRPWLIEVNASPSLARENPLDIEVKERLVADTLRVVAPPYFDRAVWGEMLRWRLAERGRASGAPAG